jgi:hypothetical protein
MESIIPEDTFNELHESFCEKKMIRVSKAEFSELWR